MLHGSEDLVATEQPGLLFARPRAAELNSIRVEFDRLSQACVERNEVLARAVIATLVPEYTSAGQGTSRRVAE